MRDEPTVIPSIARAGVLGLVLLTAACGAVAAPLATPSPVGSGAVPSTQPSSTPGASASSAAVTPSPAPTTPATGSTAAPSPSVTEQQAIDAVKAFAPNATGLRVTQVDQVSMGAAYRVQSTEIVADVDVATGQVIMFLDNAAMPTSPAVKLTKAEALEAATAWLAAHAIATTGLTPAASLMDHGSTQEYQVVFEGRVDGVRVPHRVDVSVDPETGGVFAFVLFSRAFSAPPAPKLTRDEAIAAARAEEKDVDAKVTSTDLAIAFDPSGTQLLVYELDLTRTDGYYVKVQVDAVTGAVTVVGRG